MRPLLPLRQFGPAALVAALGYGLGGLGIAVIFGVASLAVVVLARIPLAPVSESRAVRLFRRRRTRQRNES